MFENRQHVGELLSVKIPLEIATENIVVMGIARGGVIVAKEVADALGMRLKVIVIKKIGSPQSSELALGAVGPDETVYLDHQMLVQFRLKRSEVKELIAEAKKKHKKVEEELSLKRESLQGKTVLLIDDGVATGATAICAALFAEKKGAEKIVLATPLISPRVAEELLPYVDTIISLRKEEHFRAVGEFYKSFPQTSTEELIKLLSK